jgi:hypothetical protein
MAAKKALSEEKAEENAARQTIEQSLQSSNDAKVDLA